MQTSVRFLCPVIVCLLELRYGWLALMLMSSEFQAELQRMKQQAAESKTQLEQMEKEVAKLQQVIRESDAERKRQMKELDQVWYHCEETDCGLRINFIFINKF